MKQSSGHESRREARPLDITLDLSPRQESYSYTNRRTANTKAQRVYPLLLLFSTAVAGGFCYAYITKPVLTSHSSPPLATNLTKAIPETPPKIEIKKETEPNNSLGQKPKKTPATANQDLPQAPRSTGYEESNIRMQHILDAESASGDIHRIVIDVPALYKSRNLRWTQEDAAEARVLLKRLEDYQEKSRALRDEGGLILKDWNKLMDASVPNQVLRADSPSISTNLLKSSRLSQSPKQDSVKIQRDQESP